METIKSTLKTEAIFSDDKQHRYLLRKHGIVKNNQSQSLQCIRIMMAFSILTVTTQLIMNKVSETYAFGSINFVLILKYQTPINLKHLTNVMISIIIYSNYEGSEESDEVILAWGAYAKARC